MKRILLLILFLLFVLPISAYAATPETGQLFLVTQLTNIIHFLSSVLCLIATLIVVYGAYGYVHVYKNEEARERGKWHMLYGGIGLFISITIAGMAKLINYMTGNSPPVSNGFPILVFGTSFSLLLLLIVYSFYRRNQGKYTLTKAEKEEVSSVNVSVSSEELHTYLVLLSKSSYLFHANQTELHGDIEKWSATYFVHSSSISLDISRDKRHIMSSTLTKESAVPELQLAENVSLEGEAIPLSVLFASIHHSFLSQYLHQHHRIEEWAKIKTASISSDAVFQSILAVGKLHQGLLLYATQCTSEQKHFLEVSFFRDIDRMFEAYKNLSPLQQKNHEAGFIERMDTLTNQLQSIQETIDEQKEQNVNFAFRIIDEKYDVN